MGSTFCGINPLEELVIHKEDDKQNEHVKEKSYADILKPKEYMHENTRVHSKPVMMVHGEPSIT